jgi:hypothetical protein
MFNLYLVTTRDGQFTRVGITRGNGKDRLDHLKRNAKVALDWGRVLNFELATNDLREAQAIEQRVRDALLKSERVPSAAHLRPLAWVVHIGDGLKAFFVVLNVLKKTTVWKPKNQKLTKTAA